MSDHTPSSDRQPLDRRSFFRRVVVRSLDQVQRVSQAVVGQPWTTPSHANTSVEDTTPSAPSTRYLRPPGALTGEDFTNTCSRCGVCVRVCPAQCIHMDPSVAGGLPHVVASRSPCVLCDELACMRDCPTGALQLPESVKDLDMGTAVVDHDRCLRSATPSGTPVEQGKGDNGCRLCVADCPLDDEAIGLGPDSRVQVRSGCVGCGVCERVCPTTPPAVWVEPSGVSAGQEADAGAIREQAPQPNGQ